jgi:AcrR family transcriptional regulator
MKAHHEVMTEVAARPGLRERQRQETHHLIRRAAYELTLERGLSAVSVQAVCAAAGVSARTFFNHFRSKEEALIPDMADFPPESRNAFVGGAEPDLLRALEILLRGHLDCLEQEAGPQEGPVAMKRLLEANPELLPRALAVFETLEQRVAALVAQRTGRAPGDSYCTVAAMTASAALRAAFSVWDDDRPASSGQLQTLLPAVFDVLRQVVGAPGADRVPPGRP